MVSPVFGEMGRSEQGRGVEGRVFQVKNSLKPEKAECGPWRRGGRGQRPRAVTRLTGSCSICWSSHGCHALTLQITSAILWKKCSRLLRSIARDFILNQPYDGI